MAHAWHGSGLLWGNTNWDLPAQRWVVWSQLGMNKNFQNTVRSQLLPRGSSEATTLSDSKKIHYSGLELFWHTDILRAQHASLCPLRCQTSQKDLLHGKGVASWCTGSGEMCHSLTCPLPGGQQLFLSYSFASCLRCKSNLRKSLYCKSNSQKQATWRPLICFLCPHWTCIICKRARPNLIICNPAKLKPVVSIAPEGVSWNAGECDVQLVLEVCFKNIGVKKILYKM